MYYQHIFFPYPCKNYLNMNLLSKILPTAVLLLCILQISITSVHAQNFSFVKDEEKVTSIHIKGNKRIEKKTILTFIDVKVGSPYSAKIADDTIKKLFATGMFSDAKVTFNKGKMTVTVDENAIINFITIEGNARIKDDIILSSLSLKQGSIYTKNKVRSGVAQIRNVYTRKGHASVKIVPKIIRRDFNRVDLIFEVNEGEPTRIQSINFINNNAFTDSDLRSEISSEEDRWWRIFSSSDNFDPDRLNYDVELIKQFYRNNGYPNIEVLSAATEVKKDGRSYFITFTLEEGEKYLFDNFTYENSIVGLKTDGINDIIRGYKNSNFNIEAINKLVEKIMGFASDQGYALVEIEPRIDFNEKKRVANVTFVIKSSPRVYVERIDIKGNLRTEDKVIRREFSIAEGDPFTQSAITEAKRRLNYLNFFKEVRIDVKPGSERDKVIIVVTVSEKSTGSVKLGVGYSSIEKVVGSISVAERNFLGKGQYASLNLGLSKTKRDIVAEFTEPYFLGERLSLGGTLFNTEKDNTSISSYKYKTTGATVNVGLEIAENTNFGVSYGLSRENIYDVGSNAPLSIQELDGKYTKSTIGYNIKYSTINHPYLPTRGVLAIFQQSYAGLGGSVKYLRNEIKVAQFTNLGGDFLLTLKGKFGSISGLGGQNVRINDNFFLGDSDMRGFSLRGLGPRDVATGTALGGKKYFYSTAGVSYKVNDALGLRAELFTDIGSVYDSDLSRSTETYNDKTMRASVGLSLSLDSPLGPLRLDFAKPIKKQDYDRTTTFRFGINQIF